MATGSRVSVGTSPTLIALTTSMDGQDFLIRNRSASTVVLGGDDVAVATGVELLSGEDLPLTLNSSESGLYGRVASGTAEVQVLKVN